MNTYLEQFNNQNENNHDFFEQLRNYAEKHNVPIIKRDSLVLIQGLLNIIDAKDMKSALQNSKRYFLRKLREKYSKNNIFIV